MTTGSDPSKRISPSALHALKEALTHVYWYKSDLRSFLTSALDDASILGRLDWSDYKRNIVRSLVDFLARNEDVYQRQLLKLMNEVSRISSLDHLARLDDGVRKLETAKTALQALTREARGVGELLVAEQQLEERRRVRNQELLQRTEVQRQLEEWNREYIDLLAAHDPQARGYRLEKILRAVFDLFDLDPRASFKVTGEQIDGGFTFDGTDFLLEAKWQKEPVGAADLDSLAGKLARKLDNTLGLYLSINGYSEDGVRAHSSGRRLVILMDGSDVMAVLEGRIDLARLLQRKRRAASQTGNIYLRIHEVLKE